MKDHFIYEHKMEDLKLKLKLLSVLSKHMHILKFVHNLKKHMEFTKCAIANSIHKIWPRLNPFGLVWIS